MSLLSSPSWCVWCGAVWSTDADLRITTALYGRRADRDRDLDVDGRGRVPPQCLRYLIRANPRYYNIRPPSAIIYLSSIYHLFTIYLSDLRLVHIARGRKREGRKRAIMFDFGRRLWEAAGVIDAFASRMRGVTSTDMHIFRGNYSIFLMVVVSNTIMQCRNTFFFQSCVFDTSVDQKPLCIYNLSLSVSMHYLHPSCSNNFIDNWLKLA